jgi:hypothetical protein
MNDIAPDLAESLRGALGLYREILAVVERENQLLRSPDTESLFGSFSARRELAPRLKESVAQLHQHRMRWTRLSPAERAGFPEVSALLRQCQDLIMRILMLDRENEQALLRRGLLGPRHLPSHNQQRPSFVADLYRRQGLAGTGTGEGSAS